MNDPKPNPLEELKKLGAERLAELKALGTQLFDHMSPKDLFTMLFPPALGLNMLQGTLRGNSFQGESFNNDNNDCPDPELMHAVLNMARWWSTHYFSTTIEGVEHLPASTPALIVGNHSAGLMPLDALFAVNAIRDLHGEHQRVYSMVHDFAYTAPRIAGVARRMGVLRAKKENALAALESGGHVLVYPGGDKDAFRTFAERKKIILAGRKGFIRTALQAGVPIVPLVSVGLHESFFVVSKGERLAEKLGLKQRLRTEVMPFSFSFPWGFVPAFFPFIPLPTAVDMKFCPPVVVEGNPDDDSLIDDIYIQVETTMQQTMDELYDGRAPIFGR
ncbi:MAG: acyltransferase family protein [Deltaproteobacteria bacterium]|nr:acyltransferase family protein [Deltaproteobacteria bacterium]MBN2673567.1 acyltransferase family protein [Deltaproteobacteria bacterium]